METLELLAIILGFLLRLGLPLGITFLFVRFLRQLDARWQAEAQKEMSLASVSMRETTSRCWEYHNCAPHRRQSCPAYLNQENPCWDNFRVAGQMQEACLFCGFRRKALTFMAAAD